MVKGMCYNPQEKTFGCDGHRKCDKCLEGKGSANIYTPNCGAFRQPPEWATKFKCPRFVYVKMWDGEWQVVRDTLGLIAPTHPLKKGDVKK